MLPNPKNSEIASLPDRIGMAHVFFTEEPFKDEVSVSSAPPTWVRTKRSIEDDDARQDDARQDDGHDRRDLDASHDGRRILECFPSLSNILKSDDASEDGTLSTISSSDGAEVRRAEEALDAFTEFLQVLSSKDTASDINSTATFEEPAGSPEDNISLTSSEDFYFQLPDEASSTSLIPANSVDDLLLCLDKTPPQTPDHVLSKNANEKVESLTETPPSAPHLDGFLDDYFDWTPPKTPPRILSKNPSGELLYNWDMIITPPQTPENINITYSSFQLQHKAELGKLTWNSESSSPIPHHHHDDNDPQGQEQTIEDLQDILATFSEVSSSTYSTSYGNEERRLAIYGTDDQMLMKDPTAGVPSSVFDRMMDCFDPLGAQVRTYNLTLEETFDTIDTLPNSFSDDCMPSDDEEDVFLPCWNSNALDVCIDDIMGVTPEESSTRRKLLHSQESLLGSKESESELFLQLEDEPKHNDVEGTTTTTGDHTFQTQEEQEPFRLDLWMFGQAFKM